MSETTASLVDFVTDTSMDLTDLWEVPGISRSGSSLVAAPTVGAVPCSWRLAVVDHKVHCDAEFCQGPHQNPPKRKCENYTVSNLRPFSVQVELQDALNRRVYDHQPIMLRATAIYDNGESVSLRPNENMFDESFPAECLLLKGEASFNLRLGQQARAATERRDGLAPRPTRRQSALQSARARSTARPAWPAGAHGQAQQAPLPHTRAAERREVLWCSPRAAPSRPRAPSLAATRIFTHPQSDPPPPPPPRAADLWVQTISMRSVVKLPCMRRDKRGGEGSALPGPSAAFLDMPALSGPSGSELPGLMAELKAALHEELKAELHEDLKAELAAELRAELKAELKWELNAELRAELFAEFRRGETLAALLPGPGWGPIVPSRSASEGRSGGGGGGGSQLVPSRSGSEGRAPPPPREMGEQELMIAQLEGMIASKQAAAATTGLLGLAPGARV